jgi:hypothetical protein
VATEKYIQNIPANCYNHYFRYDALSQIDDTFNGLSLSELSGVFITFTALSFFAVCVFVAEISCARVTRLQQTTTTLTNHDHNVSETEVDVGAALERIALKWRISQLVCEAGSVHLLEMIA